MPARKALIKTLTTRVLVLFTNIEKKMTLNRNKIVLKFILLFLVVSLQLMFLPSAHAGLTILHSMSISDGHGANEGNNLILDGTTFYGFIRSGGDNNRGVIFSMDTNGSNYLKLYDFGGSTNPESPAGSPTFLTVSGTDYLYGMSRTGGTNDAGTVFRIETDGSNMEVLHEFEADTVDNGDGPRGSLVASGSTLYGVTNDGGANDDGCIFKIDTDGSNFAIVWDFEDAADNGAFPEGSIIIDNGFIYGTTSDGGANSVGAVYKYSISGDSLTILHNFAGFNTDGATPRGELLLSGTTLYGTTTAGNTVDNRGTIFKVDTDGSNYLLMHNCRSSTEIGDIPYGGLTLLDGKLYGMTVYGGEDNEGVIFEIETDGSNYTVSHELTNASTSGEHPYASFLLVGDTLYGMTEQGGASDNGVIFSYTPPALDHLTVSGWAYQLVAGVGRSVTVTAKMDNGDTDTTYTGDHSITFSGPANGPDGTIPTFSDKNSADINMGTATTLTFDSGVATSTMKLYKVEDAIIDADDGTYDTTGSVTYDFHLTVVPAATLTDYTVSATTPQTQYVGWSETVTGRDAYQNTVTNDSSSVATMTDSGSALFYTDDTYATQTTTYTLSSGTATAYIKNYDNETITVTATTGAANGTSSNIVVNSASITPSISSAANQEFRVDGDSTAISTITITDDASTPGINTEDDIRIRIPSGFNMTWDTSDATATLGGTASAKASTSVSYEDSNKTLVIDVTSDFAAGQTLTVAGLSFNNFSAVSATDNLELEIDNAGTAIDTDDKTIEITTTDHLIVTGTGTQTAGGSQAITITAKDNNGDTDTGYTGDKSLTFSGPSAAPSGTNPTCSDKNAADVNFGTATTITFTDGVATSTMKLYRAQTVSVDVTDGTYGSSGDAAYDLDLTVSPAGLSSYAITATTPQTQYVGWSETVTGRDAYQNTVTNDSSSVATMTDSGSALFYTNNTYATQTTTYTLSSGTATVYVKDAATEITALIATTGAANGTSGNIVVNASNPTISSAANQQFDVGDSATEISTITITEDDASPSINTAGNIRIRIPAAFNMVWDTSDATATIGGTASANVDTAVSYEDSNKTLVINVTSDFTVNQTLTIAGLSFTTFSAESNSDNLELEIDNAGTVADTDDKTIEVVSTDHLVITGSSTQTAGSSQTITITAKKSDGDTSTSYTGDKSLTFSGPSAAPSGTNPTCSDKNAADVNFGTATTITFTDGVATSTMKLYRAQTVSVDVTDGTYGSSDNAAYDLDLTVSPAGLSSYAVTATTPQTQYTGWSETVTGRDVYQNTVTNDSSSVATMTDSGSALFYTNNTYATQTTTYTLSSGTATVYVKDSTAETITLTATTGSANGTSGNIVVNSASLGSASIDSPADGNTVSSQPIIIGSTDSASTAFSIKGTSGSSVVTVASGTSDVNGNFRVQVGSSTLLDAGANNLQLYVGATAGPDVDITVAAAPATSQVPTITSHSDGSTITTNPFTLSGTASPGLEVRVQALDEDGNVILNCGSATADASTGAYNISVDAVANSLACGSNTLSITTYDGSGSAVTTSLQVSITFTDPFGVVFDSVSDNPIENVTVTLYYDNDAGAGRDWIQAVSGTHIVAGDSNPQITGSDGFYSFNCIDGDFYITVSAAEYDYPSTKADADLPAGRTIVTGSKGEIFTVAGVIIEMDHPMDSGSGLLKVTKDANKKDVVIGDIVTYTVTIENETASSVTSVYLEDKIPAGFKYLDGKVTLDGAQTADPTGNRPLTFNIGTVSANSTSTLKYQLVVGSGVTFGNYENTAFAKYSDGTTISNTASETVKVVPDPLFDLGTVIGKVFNDKNESGIQDSPQSVGGQVIVEEAIPNMRIVTENGAVITTDKHGKYHLAGIIPGRHLFRLDERALPQGAYLTTEKVVIVDITPGILAKVNFGIKLPEGVDLRKIPFQISQDRGIPKPRLNASLLNDELIIKDKQLKERAEFRIFTNYHLFIKKWRLDILDQDTKRIVKTLKGSKDNIFKPIYWNGKDKRNKLITTDKNYSYRLTVTGAKGKKDITNERSIKVIGQKLEAVSIEGDKTDEEKQEEYQEWINQQNKRNDIEKQAIPIKGETIRITNSSLPVANIKIIKEGKIKGQVPLVQQESLTAGEFLEGPQSQDEDQSEPIDIIFPQGEYDIEVIPSQSETTAGSKSVYTKSIKVGENYLFFVAMGDAKMGYTFHRGDIEPIQHDDKFREGFWSEGKGSYYLKGKIKGKYLITSSFDSERDQKELFKNLDPDKYYPVYGDESSINYNATNTQGMLYLLIEWDKSKAIWGNYNTALTDTEFTNFSRTLYGGKVHLESVSTTKFGQPDIKLIAFRARAQQKAAHNEFTGTGGSLFYLKHKDVIEGSDKVVIEIRDKITGLVLGSEEMREGADYETDYSNGRIIFWKTVRFITESSSIISSQLLDGNPVYVVVDYEYETKDKYDEGTVGARVQKSLTDYIDLGATYVKEELQKENYELKGTDATIHLGKDIKLTAEYAESKSEAMGSFISTDGGLSFTELPTGEYSKGKAYGLKGQAYLFDHKLNLSSYYKWIDNDFSTSATSSQQGKELIGIGATYDLSQKTRLTVSHDIQKLIDDGNAQTQLQVGATKTKTTSAQVTHDLDRLKLTGEYRHQEIKERKEEFESEVNREEDTLAVRADYELTKKVDVSLEQQATLKGTANNQTSVGIVARVFDWLSLRAKEIIGNEGTATSVGATSSVKDKLDVSADYTRANYKTEGASDIASLGVVSQVDEKTKVHTTYAVSSSTGEGRTSSIVYGVKKKLTNSLELSADRSFVSNSSESTHSNIFGLSGDINDQWAARASFERGIIQNHDGTQDKRNAGSLGLGFVDKNKETGETKLKASSKIELRFDEGQEDKRQYLLYNTVEKNVNPDTTLFAKANFSQTKNTDADSTESQFKELVFGSAYRPVDIDWLNLLAKYTYLEDSSPSSQSDINDIEKEKAHVFAAEGVIDLSDKWQLSEKIAYKISEEKVTGFDFTKTSTWLLINRLGYNIDEEWQIAGEYRLLTQKQADDQKHGALIELSRNIGEFIQIGVGYNFTDFNDDLTRLDYTAHGPFFRITGKFYDRTPEEIERVKQKQKERKEELARKREEKERDRRLRIEKRNKKRLLKKKISDINKEAKKLYREKLYAESTFKFKEVLELDLKNKTALKYLQHISQKMKMEGKTKQKNIVF